MEYPFIQSDFSCKFTTSFIGQDFSNILTSKSVTMSPSGTSIVNWSEIPLGPNPISTSTCLFADAFARGNHDIAQNIATKNSAKFCLAMLMA